MTDEHQEKIRQILNESENLEKELEDAKKALEDSEKDEWVTDEIKKLDL